MSLQQQLRVVPLLGIAGGPIKDPLIGQTLNEHFQKETIGIGMIMQLAEGGSLDQLLYPRRRNLNLKLKLKICSEISEGIMQLHTINVIHGDLKPSNILFSHPVLMNHLASFHVFLTDFSFARFQRKDRYRPSIGESTLLLTNSEIEGPLGLTPMYTAPEMLKNMSEHEFLAPTRSCDLYALGLIIWEVSSC